MTTLERDTPVILRQRCNHGHLHVFVVPYKHAIMLRDTIPNCEIVAIDDLLLPQARLLVKA